MADGSEVAKQFGVTIRQVTQLVKEEVITAEKVKGVYKYDLAAVTRQYIAYLSKKAYGREKDASVAERERDKLDAEIALKRAKAKMAELELKELEGKMHSAEDVEAMTTDIVMALRSMLLAIPGKTAVDMVEVKTATEAYDRIQKEIYSVLDYMSNYKYDPKEYQKRVRERQGWTGEKRDDEEE
jgi:phage terminase Nu1 subunit (DNA packaging protein)